MKDVFEILAYFLGMALLAWALAGFPTIHINFSVTEETDEDEAE